MEKEIIENGDFMGEIYPPDYQKWLDSQKPTEKDMDDQKNKEKPF